MKRGISLIARTSALAILAAGLFVSSASAGVATKILHSFNTDTGNYPVSGVVFDRAGNLYGTTPTGGSKNCGTAFQLTRNDSGKWAKTVIFEFTCTAEGGNPMTGLTIDAQGNLYGTTWLGGSHAHGTVFRLTKGNNNNNVWTEKVLHDFAWGTDGGAPAGTLVFDNNGSLYGTCFSGGAFGFGNVFRLTPDQQDKWTLTTLHSFNRDQHDGYNPISGVVFDNAGRLYGATKEGGAKGFGVVYRLSPDGQGAWTEKVLHTFNPANGKDGSYPVANLVVDADGNIFGTAQQGGKEHFYGIVFKLALDLDSKWQYSILHSFSGGSDGALPVGNLITDVNGNLYGTAASGGINNGIAFKLSPTDTGKWKETILHTFKAGTDGSKPQSGLTFDAAGNLYGTTKEGGANNMGTVYQLLP